MFSLFAFFTRLLRLSFFFFLSFLLLAQIRIKERGQNVSHSSVVKRTLDAACNEYTTVQLICINVLSSYRLSAFDSIITSPPLLLQRSLLFSLFTALSYIFQATIFMSEYERYEPFKGVLGSESRTGGRLGSPAIGRLKFFWNLS